MWSERVDTEGKARNKETKMKRRKSDHGSANAGGDAIKNK